MSGKSTILVVEDKSGEREAMARVLRLESYEVKMAASVAEANDSLGDSVDLIVSDLRLGKGSGIDLLRRWKTERPSIPIIMVTAFGEVDSAVEAMKLGAEDYLSKPVDPEELLLLVGKCLQARERDAKREKLEGKIQQDRGFPHIIGDSQVMRQVFDHARRAALAESTVLIVGESGTGKELVAEAIHGKSPRSGGPFVTVNMAAVPASLVESELFGHTKGAFTGATESRAGRFEAADGGTLFIDEIGDFALASQAKLLRVLEDNCVTPVGSNDDKQVDVRVVAATSRNLDGLVRNDEFREDLYYRLNVVMISLPPLRERTEDIPLLVSHFVNVLQSTTGKQVEVSPELLQFFREHTWPGNVRQLRNCIESMIVLAGGKQLTLDDIPPSMIDDTSDSSETSVAGGTLEEIERVAVQRTLAEHDGNRTHAAEALGISVRTLQRKLKTWGIEE